MLAVVSMDCKLASFLPEIRLFTEILLICVNVDRFILSFYTETRCTDEEFECHDLSLCIHKNSVCDGFVDCSDASDEDSCTAISGTYKPKVFNLYILFPYLPCLHSLNTYAHQSECEEGQFRCSNGICISESERCNGYQECLDGTDEKDCRECHNGSFQ